MLPANRYFAARKSLSCRWQNGTLISKKNSLRQKHPNTPLNRSQTRINRAFKDRGVLVKHPPHIHLTPTSAGNTDCTDLHRFLTKTEKAPLMAAAAYSLTCCSSALVPESKLSHKVQAHHSWYPNTTSPCGKTAKTVFEVFLNRSFESDRTGVISAESRGNVFPSCQRMIARQSTKC